MSDGDGEHGKSNDWFRRPLGAVVWWGLPLLAGVAANYSAVGARILAFVWAAAFAWMGAGCVLNALRCGRLHCFISGPAFLLGAIVTLLIGLGVFGGPHMLTNTVSATLLAALLSFVPEWFWRRYA